MHAIGGSLDNVDHVFALFCILQLVFENFESLNDETSFRGRKD